MLANIKKTIDEFGMISTGETVIIALSGGADSVSLVLALDLLKSEFNIKIEACHVNHHLRGESSDNDELFVSSFCNDMNIPLKIFSIDIKPDKHQSVEEAAREARYNCFKYFGDSVKIATAHSASDNLETVVLNIIRGTALRGLCGIPPIRNNIIRPLINSTRTDIINFLEQRNQKYAVDMTNFSDEYTRNRVRHNIIPECIKINPSLTAGVSNMCKILRDDDRFLTKLAIEGLNNAEIGNNLYNSTFLSKLDNTILNRIISMILTKNNISPSSLRINGINELIKKNSGKINICKNKFAIVQKNTFCIKIIHQNYKK